MSDFIDKNYLVAVIGAGPAGLYAAQYLARQGVQVVLFNRDIKPGGLAEYGIFPDKYKMRLGLQKQFNRILNIPSIRYQGNVVVGQSGDIKLDQLRQAGFQAFMVTTGAQVNNWLGLPGEDLEGVYQANDIVFHYNRLPDRAGLTVNIGRQVAIIGVGNVMLDIVHYLKQMKVSRMVTAYARRGPTEVKFDNQTLEPVAGCLDMGSIKQAVDASQSELKLIGKNEGEFFDLLAAASEKATDCDSGLQFGMQFLRSPRRLVSDKNGRVKEIVFEKNRLALEDDQVVSYGTGDLETVSADTVIFSVGSQVDAGFGLPAAQGHFDTAAKPRFPVDGISYEVYNPDLCANCEDIFVSGWARLASEGIVGLARKDAERGARAVLGYLKTLKPVNGINLDDVIDQLPPIEKVIVASSDLENLERAEREKAAKKGLPGYKFKTDGEMLRVIERFRRD